MTPGYGSARPDRPATRSWGDAGLAATLLLGTALYCWLLPHAIGASDEGLFLYEAKRVAEGAVLYRDVFELVTPLSTFLLAASFRVFGADVGTARGMDAVVHGMIVLAVFGISRRLGVRRSVAVAVAVLHPAWFRSAWGMASPHWLSTLFGLGLLAELVRAPAARPGWAGLWAGLVIAVQQQRGVALAGAAVAVVVLDQWMTASPLTLRRLVGPLGTLAGGMLLGVLPAGGYAVGTAGARAVFDALVVHPLVNYRAQSYGVAWGANLTPWMAHYTLPRVLPWLAVLAPIELLRAAIESMRKGARGRRSAVLGGYGLACMASILYFPDVPHIGFISPVLAILLADILEAILRVIPRRGAVRLVEVILVGALLVPTLLQLRRVMAGLWRDFPVTYDSPFGRVQFHDASEVALRERLRALLDEVPGRRLFIYPGGACVYLETGATNPTPFQIVIPRYTSPEQFGTIVAALERDRTPYVLRTFALPDDPLRAYLDQHYDRVFDTPTGAVVLRRRAAAGAGPASDHAPGAPP